MENKEDTVDEQVTFAVSCVGNVKALCMCLSSVLFQRVKPGTIHLRFEGEFPSFAEFYLEQLSEFARILGINWEMTVGRSLGVRNARQSALECCQTPFLWMGDDDVIYHPGCLSAFVQAHTVFGGKDFGYAVGLKPDLNNRRGYTDFRTAPLQDEEIKPGCSYNSFYWNLNGPTVACDTADTGNLYICPSIIREAGVLFCPFKQSANAGGEDTLFAMQCTTAGLKGFFVSSAWSFHLEKPPTGKTFNEFNARAEALLRSGDLIGAKLPDSFMPFVQRIKK